MEKHAHFSGRILRTCETPSDIHRRSSGVHRRSSGVMHLLPPGVAEEVAPFGRKVEIKSSKIQTRSPA